MIKGFAEAFSKAFVAKLCLNAILLIISSKKIIKSDKKISLILSILINKYEQFIKLIEPILD